MLANRHASGAGEASRALQERVVLAPQRLDKPGDPRIGKGAGLNHLDCRRSGADAAAAPLQQNQGCGRDHADDHQHQDQHEATLAVAIGAVPVRRSRGSAMRVRPPGR